VRSDGYSSNSAWSQLSSILTRRSALMDRLLSGASWSSNERDHLFVSKQAKEFVELSGISGLDDPADARAGVIWDFDHDGWQDFAMINASSPQLRIYRNQIGDRPAATTRMIAVRLVGGNQGSAAAPSLSNRDAYGARLYVETGDSDAPLLTREHRCGEGYAAQNSNTLIVGIGASASAKSIEVRFPSGTRQKTSDVPAGSLVTAYEDPAQSPTGEAFVVEPYDKVTSASPTVATAGQGGSRLLLVSKAEDDAKLPLRLYTTMATWCAVCKKELPQAKQLRERFPKEELELYGVPLDDEAGPEELQAYVEANQPAYELLTELSTQQAADVRKIVQDALKTDALPASIVTDAQGNIVHTQTGLPSVSTLRELLLKVAPPKTAAAD
jgi:thiol-disulfide isomerase/thioredoxin